MVKRRQIRLALALFGLSVLGMASSVHAEFFPGNLFELRPPRVRVATPQETADTPERRQSFAIQESPPASPAQESNYLTDADQLAAVFPVSGGSFSSGGGRSEVGGMSVEGNMVTVDNYNFRDFFGPIGATLVAPWEQSVFVGALPAGDYIFNLRVFIIPALTDRITVLYRRLPDVALNITVIDKSYMPCSGD